VDIVVTPNGTFSYSSKTVRCALGRGGVSDDKKEGDGATPVGCYPLRRVLYRPDRIAAPETALPVRPIDPSDGWCDAPCDSRYNRPVTLPYPASAEALWRDDGLYDVIVVLGHNDDPPVAGAGSAIFLHVARPDYGPTEGCVAVALADLIELLRRCRTGDRLCVRSDLD
jgi:L,D-peptidoglycan transpeptidase YkuD (ErfK/YbiS/YcfS/YnhG family)